MLRFYVAIALNVYKAIYLIPKMNYQAARPEKYSEEERYGIARYIVECLRKKGRITTNAYGLENLPKEGGYIMYPNHQGKYDVVGMIHTHDAPCSFIMDEAKSYKFIVKQVVNLVGAKRLVKDDLRQSMHVINEVAREVSEGRKYIIFPEGGYRDKNNEVEEFKGGSFKAAYKAKAPIVPVALVDSYRAFSEWSLKKVTTQVHYLKPLYYEEYKDMKTTELAEVVRRRIEEVVNNNFTY